MKFEKDGKKGIEMEFGNLQIIFHLNGEGVYYDPAEPLHLDALLAWILIGKYIKFDCIGKSDVPFDTPLPVEKWKLNRYWGWKTSALFPGSYFESIQYWRKKFRQDKIEYMKGSVNLKQGRYREYNTPIRLIVTDKMIAYCNGDLKKVKKVLRKLKYLGKKTAYGKGKIIGLEIIEIPEDYSIVKDGKAMRWLPKKNGIRLCRCRPPYWNRIDRINCCEVGDKYNEELIQEIENAG